MRVSQKNLPKSQVVLAIELLPEEVEPYRQKTLENLAENIQVEGFRTGHVPAPLLQERLGEARVFAEMAELALREAYQKALKEKNIDVLGDPQVEVLKLAPGNPLAFRITTAVVPEIQLPDYKKIATASARKPVAVEEQEVREALEWLQKNTDNFAKATKNFPSADDLKESIKEGLQHEKETRETDRLRQEIVEHIAEKSSIDIPEVLVEREKRVLLQDLKQSIPHMMQISFDEYLKQTGKTEQEILKSFWQEAEKRVKRFLVIRKVAEQEAIQPEQQEVEEEANRILAHYKSVNKAQKDLDPTRLKEYTEGVIRHEKTLQFLESLAK